MYTSTILNSLKANKTPGYNIQTNYKDTTKVQLVYWFNHGRPSRGGQNIDWVQVVDHLVICSRSARVSAAADNVVQWEFSAVIWLVASLLLTRR